ncbi:helix-turn-helix domain-containing protein (plasmid) [Brevundimonas staleyi]|uniref:Helix-turn-helix domain-containing protein n=1 Tax=Brevundimonas staleyi TaxID=74326 RepID=A0ABW0FQ91_9CAUL
MTEGGGGRPTIAFDPDAATADAALDKCDVIDAHVGRQIKTVRMLCGMSQPDLAGPLGVTFQQLQKYERGENRIAASKLYLAASTLKVDINRFFEGLPDPTGGVSDQALLTAQRDMVAFLAEPEGRDLALHLPKLTRPLRSHVAKLVRAMAGQATADRALED